MDSLVASFPAVADRDLMLALDHGVAWQADIDRAVEVAYGEAYFDKYVGYEGSGVACAINAGRVALVNKWAGRDGDVIDIGIGSGEFIKSRGRATRGHDVNPKAAQWLKARGLWADDLRDAGAVCFWDVLEHVREPDGYFSQLQSGALLFTCLPIFEDLTRIRQSRHYRPNEHFYYWTELGFVAWMIGKGFDLLDRRDFETTAGRDSILSFAFRKRD